MFRDHFFYFASLLVNRRRVCKKSQRHSLQLQQITIHNCWHKLSQDSYQKIHSNGSWMDRWLYGAHVWHYKNADCTITVKKLVNKIKKTLLWFFCK